MIDAYRRYAAIRGPRIVGLKLVVFGLALFLARDVPLLAYWILALALLDAFARRPVREGAPDGLVPVARPLAGGFVAGAAMISAAIAVYAAAGWYNVLSADDALGRFGYWLALYAAVGIAEETVFRGLLFRVIRRRAGSVAALIVTSLSFGLIHVGNPNASWSDGLAIAAAAGLPFGALYLASGSLWAPIGAHWAWNLFEGPVWGTGVSGLDTHALVVARVRGPEIWTGGAFGPEGGLVVVIIGLVVAAALLVVACRRGRPAHHRPLAVTGGAAGGLCGRRRAVLRPGRGRRGAARASRQT